MDRMRPLYVRQQSNPGTPGGSASPTRSPLHRHARSGSTGYMKKAQTKAAAQRLAQVMAHQLGDDEDDEDDDLSYEYTPASGAGSIGLAGGRAPRGRSPMSVRPHVEQPHSARSSAIGRPSLPVNSIDQLSLARMSTSTRSAQSAAAEQSQPSRTVVVGRSPQSANAEQPSLPHISTPTQSYHSAAAEQSQPTRSVVAGRLPQSANTEQPSLAHISTPTQSFHSAAAEQSLPARSVVVTSRPSQSTIPEQPPSARSTSGSRPFLGVKTVTMVPASVPISLKPSYSVIPTETPVEHRRDKSRLSVDWDNMSTKETSNHRSASALQDELDMLQEENESLLEKLQLAEERCDEAEDKAWQLEKQISSLGEGVNLEARLLSRKEAALRQREVALRDAGQTQGGKTEEIANLQIEAEIARDEATSAWEKLHEVQTISQRTILTREEMEEVVLKRCWLARYWSLCIKYGIHSEIAEAKHEHWSSLAPSPMEVVLAAGQKAKEKNSYIYDNMNERDRFPRDKNEHSGELNIESMLLVEKGLRELASLKVEDAILLAMAQHRRKSILKSGDAGVYDLKLPIEGQTEVFELSKEESEDVLFKQAWLTYFWRRAKNHGLEIDVADERLQFLINQSTRSPTSQDAVDVERGLTELRKLGIEDQLWEDSRKGSALDNGNVRAENDT
ncbi:hypothetical protein ACJRO7_032874 [Eucalyptus globulus]|uniref:Coiled-coil domain-containing protein SCD2 n=1 Tax=Eucalyptus globulus TaxID=34317 RepID=A0ABD3JR24_EUCGL